MSDTKLVLESLKIMSNTNPYVRMFVMKALWIGYKHPVVLNILTFSSQQQYDNDVS